MNQVFEPVLNRLHVFNKHSLLYLLSGSGIFQVDFRNYNFSAGKVIFLSPGQYFQLLSGNFLIQLYEFPANNVQQVHNSRYLFKHLVSLGHIHIRRPVAVTNTLQYIEMGEHNSSLLCEAIEDWIALNPFKSSRQDINLLFDLKDIIDQKFREPIDLKSISKQVHEKPYRINLLAREKLQHTVNKLATDKIVLEAKRKIIFTDLSAKEVAYETGFKDPDYFNRFFKKQTSCTPLEFRKKYEFDERDTFVNDLLGLIDAHFREEHFAEFYANQLAVAPQTLSKKIAQKLSITFTRLMADKLVQESKQLLQQQMPINSIAFNLGFKEANHFSAFFKNNTGKTPTQFLAEIKA